MMVHSATGQFGWASVGRDAISGMVVFLVALPLCLGVAIASGAQPISGVIAGIIGGMVVGLLSGSQTSVSGPAAGLTAIVLSQISSLGDFRYFLVAVVLAGAMQVLLGSVRAGSLAAFFPSSVIKGLLAAIGVILILKQIPHLLGHDTDAEGDMAFQQTDKENTFSEFLTLFDEGQVHAGAMIIGMTALFVLVVWDAFKPLKKSVIPVQLIVVAIGIGLNFLFAYWGPGWQVNASHLVELPVVGGSMDGGTTVIKSFLDFLVFPDFSALIGSKGTEIGFAGLTLAIVASLETLLNLEAIDKLDPMQRKSPASRELIAQGIGNMSCGMIGGIPLTSVIVRGSVNINAGSRTKLSTIIHGILLGVSVLFFAKYLNMIPISCLAAILLVTGFKLASPKLFRTMWEEGYYQFLPFIITLLAIVFTDLLIGTMIGLAIAIVFILNSNLRRPLRTVRENYPGGEVTRITLANQVSFLNRANLERTLFDLPRGTHILLDGSECDYIDPDILSLMHDFRTVSGPARGVQVSVRGFDEKFRMPDEIRFLDYPTRELQTLLSAEDVLQVLREGNDRFRAGQRLQRDLGRQIGATSQSQHPLAVVLSCIDSRSPVEIIFDLGLGDIFSVRVAGNVTSPKVFGSIEYSVACAGAKLIVVLGHTSCGAVTAAVNFASTDEDVLMATGCQNLGPIVSDIYHSVDMVACHSLASAMSPEKRQFIDAVARKNVLRSVRSLAEQSGTIADLVRAGKVAIVGAMYDIGSGSVDFMLDEAVGLVRTS